MECARRGESWKQNAFTLYPISANEAAAEEPARPVPTTMISSNLLFAGDTNGISPLCLVHLSAIAPAGTLESNAIISDL